MEITIRALIASLMLLPWSVVAGSPAPWSNAASWTIDRTEVRFESEGTELAGTLFSPGGTTGGPVIVVVQQNGTTTRDNPLFLQLAEVFSAIGYSVFSYDRRGFGESGGSSGRLSYDVLARDAVAAHEAIGELDEVDSRQAGFWGISQGGWLAMEAAMMSDPAFVMVVSSPLTTPGRQMEVLAYNYVLAAGFGEAAADRALAVRRLVMDDYFRGRASFDEAHAALEEVADEPWLQYAWLPAADDLPENVEESSWIEEMAYDPTEAFFGTEAPLLLLLGGEDLDIPVRETLDIIARRGGDGDNRQVVVLPGADHLMRISDEPLIGEEANAERLVSESIEYFLVMGHWLGRLQR